MLQKEIQNITCKHLPGATSGLATVGLVEQNSEVPSVFLWAECSNDGPLWLLHSPNTVLYTMSFYTVMLE